MTTRIVAPAHLHSALQPLPIGLPRLVRALFADEWLAPLWFLLRLYVGWQWLSAGLEKVQQPAWTRTGTALKGFWTAATRVHPGQQGAAIHYGWYYDFIHYMLQHGWYSWFAKLVAFGEVAVGLALLLGALVGVAAFFGAFMNLNFMLAGTASSNPVLLLLSLGLLLSWRISGVIGADRYLLAALARLVRRPGWPTVRAALPRVLAFILLFGGAAAAVIALNLTFAEQPWPGYLLALAVTMAAWAAMALADRAFAARDGRQMAAHVLA